MTNPNTNKLALVKTQKPNPCLSVRTAHISVHMIVHNNVLHSTAHDTSDNLPTYPSDSHHSSDVI